MPVVFFCFVICFSPTYIYDPVEPSVYCDILRQSFLSVEETWLKTKEYNLF